MFFNNENLYNEKIKNKLSRHRFYGFGFFNASNYK